MGTSGSGLDYRDPRIAELAAAARHVADASTRGSIAEPPWVRASAYAQAMRIRRVGHLVALAVLTVGYALFAFQAERHHVQVVERALRTSIGEGRVASLEQGYRPCGRYSTPGGPKLRFIRIGEAVAFEALDGRWLSAGGEIQLQDEAFRRCATGPERHPTISRMIDAPMATLALASPR